MSFVSTYPTNIVKFGVLTGAKLVRDAISARDSVVSKEMTIKDIALAIEALVKHVIDTVIGLDKAIAISMTLKDVPIALSTIRELDREARDTTTKQLERAGLDLISIELGRPVDRYRLFRAATLSKDALEMADKLLPQVFLQILSLVSMLRTVKYGDYILAKDINTLVDVLNALNVFNQLIAYWFTLHGYELPQKVYDAVQSFADRTQKLRTVNVGDIVEPELWNLVTELLGDEYEILRQFLKYLPKPSTASETATATETSKVTELVGIVTDFVTWWLYERYRSTYLYKDKGDFLTGSELYRKPSHFWLGCTIVFEKYKEIGFGYILVKPIGLEILGQHGYVGSGFIVVYDGPTGEEKYLAYFYPHIAFVVDGEIKWAIRKGDYIRGAATTFRGSKYVYLATVREYRRPPIEEFAVSAIDILTGETVWETLLPVPDVYPLVYPLPVIADDVNNDGVTEVVVVTLKTPIPPPPPPEYALDGGSNENEEPTWCIFLINADDGTVLETIDIPYTGYRPPGLPDIGFVDVDKDEKIEYVVGIGRSTLMLIDDNGTIVWSAYLEDYVYGFSRLGISIGDIDNDNTLEAIISSRSYAMLTCVSLDDGHVEWVLKIEGGLYRRFGPPLLLDVDNDNKLELLTWSPHVYGEEVYGLYLIDDNGDIIWQKPIEEYGIYRYAVGDVDGDGKAEAVLITYLYVHVFKG